MKAWKKLARAQLVLLAPVVFGACDSGFGPGTWSDVPDTLTIFSLTRPELAGQPSAIDLVALSQRRNAAVTVETPGSANTWDLALTEQDGGFLFLPVGAFQGVDDDNAGLITVDGVTFSGLDRAPEEDSVYVTDRGVPARPGQIYAVRSRLSGSCLRFGKMEVLAVDPVDGSVQLQAVVNPFCNNRDLIAPEQDG